MQPLIGVTVIDFSTLLPGPLASLVLAEAGAEVIKVERPEEGDAMRGFGLPFGDSSVEFLLLNRGKRSIELDLKSPDALERLAPLLGRADVLIEQFRPGVMERLGLGYDALKALNPKLIYCSLTGYGQSGPKSAAAGHDLNYLAETGLLRIGAANGDPVIPPALIADIGGGAYPVVINLLLALRQRELDGQGCYLDIAMTDHLFPFQYWAQGMAEATGKLPKPGAELLTGGSPRYQVYRTRDAKFLAAAPLEQRFWDNFCDAIGLDEPLRLDRDDPQATKAAVAAIIETRTASEWMRLFADTDACVCEVVDVAEAMRDPQFTARGLFSYRAGDENTGLTAAAVPLSPQFRATPGTVPAPALGEANKHYLAPSKEKR